MTRHSDNWPYRPCGKCRRISITWWHSSHSERRDASWRSSNLRAVRFGVLRFFVRRPGHMRAPVARVVVLSLLAVLHAAMRPRTPRHTPPRRRKVRCGWAGVCFRSHKYSPRLLIEKSRRLSPGSSLPGQHFDRTRLWWADTHASLVNGARRPPSSEKACSGF